jgi:YjbE family integral membrane protein
VTDLFILSPESIAALLQVIAIDLVLAGDNAVVIGLAAASLARAQRARAILAGILVATTLRIVFAVFATQLLDIVGLLLAGGILLLWVCWKMWRELRGPSHKEVEAVLTSGDAQGPRKTFAQAAWQILIADISMSLDNVLAVSGAARDHPAVLVFGLGLSIVMMGVAASLIARMLNKHRWIAYGGLAIILYVACDMIWRGAWEVQPYLVGSLSFGSRL